jgi:hypothetical protein
MLFLAERRELFYGSLTSSDRENEKLVPSLANNEQDDQTRVKVTRLFRYIQVFNQLQNPVQRRIGDYAW